MPLSQNARIVMRSAVANNAVGTEICNVVDAGSGTLSFAARQRLRAIIGHIATADRIVTAINAGTAITGPDQAELGIAICDRVVAQEIATALSL